MNSALPPVPLRPVSPPDRTIEPRVDAALLNVVYREQPLSLAASAVFAVAITAMVAWFERGPLPWVWLGVAMLVLLGRYITSRQYERTPPEQRELRYWERRFFLGANASALAWGLIAWHAYPSASPVLDLAIVVLIGGVVSAASRTVACHTQTFIVFASLCVVPLAAAMCFSGAPAGPLMSVFALLYLLLMLLLGRGFRDTVKGAFQLQFENADLAAALQRDIEQRRAAEIERQRLQQQLQETQRLESLGVLAGGVAHDFNNLLTAILGNATLARDMLDEHIAVNDMLGQIEAAAQQAAGLCRQMLAYAGRGQLAIHPQNLSRVVADSAQLLTTTAGQRARLELRLAPELPCVMADAPQVRQIVLNLVHNAAEAMEEQDGHILVTTRPAIIDAAMIGASRSGAEVRPGPGVELAVTDNGTGMDASTVARIFEPFFTTKFTGRGLGLAAVLGIVRSHNAVLTVESRPGRGSTFRVVFPTCASASAAQPEAAMPGAGTSRRLRGRVLVVDDEEPVRRVVRQVVEQLGLSAELAASGDGALTCAAGNPDAFRLLILDMTMPGKNGASTLRDLRHRGASAPAILMSGYSEEQVRESVAGEHTIDFLQKPFDASTLRSKIERALVTS